MNYSKFKKKYECLKKNEKKNEFKIMKLQFKYACYLYKKNDFLNCDDLLFDIYNGFFMDLILIRDIKEYDIYDASYKKRTKKVKKEMRYFKSKKNTRGLNYYILGKYNIITDTSKYIDKAILLGVKEALIDKADEEKELGHNESYFKLLNRYYNEGMIKSHRKTVINLLAYCYLDGIGTTKNYDKGIAYLEENFFENDDEELLNYYYKINGIGDYQKVNDLIETKKTKKYYYSGLKEKYKIKNNDIIENKKANEYYKLAINNDNKAQYNLYLCFKNGTGVVKEDKEAFKWLKLSYDNGNFKAIDKLIECYEKGIGTDINIELANELNGLRYSKEELYNKYINANTDSEKIRWLKLSAEAGYDVAMNTLGYCYIFGKYLAQDAKKGFDLIYSAAQKGYIIAKNNLIKCYLEGIGTEINHSKAIEILNEIIDSGDKITQFYYGVCYFAGKGVTQDFEKSIEYFELSAKQGYMPSMYNLGTMYGAGKGCKKDYFKAFDCFKKCVDENYKSAYYELGYLYYYGYGCGENKSKGIELIKYAADDDANLNNKKACEFIGEYYYLKKDYVNARNYLEKSSYEISYISCGHLYNIYLKGLGTEKDDKKAFYWLEKSARLGNAKALVCVGTAYHNGFGCEKDVIKAKDYYKLAMEKGEYEGAYYLGIWYYESESLRPESKKYFEIALQNGITKSSLYLANLAMDNEDFIKAKKYYEIALQNGSTNAAQGLGYLYLYGKGVKIDYDIAMKYLLMIKNDENGFVTDMLGEIYLEKKDYLIAKKKFEEAAQKGNARAFWFLGYMYYWGEGISINYDKAFKYYSSASSKGYNHANYTLGLCYYYGHGCEEDNDKALYYFSKVKSPNDETLKSINEIKEAIKEEKRNKESLSYSNRYDDYDDDYGDYDDSDNDNKYYDYDPIWGTIDESSDPIDISPYTGMGSDGVHYRQDPFTGIYYPDEEDDDD